MLWPLVGSATWKCGNIGVGSEKTMKNKYWKNRAWEARLKGSIFTKV